MFQLFKCNALGFNIIMLKPPIEAEPSDIRGRRCSETDFYLTLNTLLYIQN